MKKECRKIGNPVDYLFKINLSLWKLLKITHEAIQTGYGFLKYKGMHRC